ncbi:MAG: hypothetical protein AAF416_04165 [Pseudomonadota bacterium]
MPALRTAAQRLAILATLTFAAATIPTGASAMTAQNNGGATASTALPIVEVGGRHYHRPRRGYGRAYRAGRRDGYRKGFRRGRYGRGYRPYRGRYYDPGPRVFFRGGVFFPPVFGGTVVIR